MNKIITVSYTHLDVYKRQDFKRKDICSQLDISIKTYKRDISFLKEQGLI